MFVSRPSLTSVVYFPSTVWLPNILQNILFCVLKKKKNHTGLEQPEGE